MVSFVAYYWRDKDSPRVAVKHRQLESLLDDVSLLPRTLEHSQSHLRWFGALDQPGQSHSPSTRCRHNG